MNTKPIGEVEKPKTGLLIAGVLLILFSVGWLGYSMLTKKPDKSKNPPARKK